MRLAFSTQPDVSPVFVAARAKGRLQHALVRATDRFAGFSRKVAVRSVGDNSTQEVEAYIARQVAKEHFVDQRFRELMDEFTLVCPEVDLSIPSESARGRYWYNLHLVLVVAQRDRITDRRPLAIIRDGCFEIAREKGHARLEDFAPSTAQKNINLGILETVLIPLPPANEIRRIVAKVDHLMSLCDALEAKLKQSQSDGDRLLAAAVHQLLNGGKPGLHENDEHGPAPLRI